MIRLLTGENSFEIERALELLAADFEGEAERIDGAELELGGLPDLLMGTSLFATRRLVIIRRLSENKVIWPVLGEWLERLSSDVELVLVEPRPDKRTKTYKDIARIAEVTEYKPWSERDTSRAAEWAAAEAERLGMKLERQLTRMIVERVGADQWRIFQALQKLAAYDKATPALVEEIIDAQPAENAFGIFEAALRRDVNSLQRTIAVLRPSEDPYRLFGLLSGQAFQLLAAGAAPAGANVAGDFGVHPYVLSKLAPHARRLGQAEISRLVTVFAEADDRLKSSATDPWVIIETALLRAARR